MSGIKYEVLAGDDLISALRGGRTGDLLDDAAYAAADEIESLRSRLSEADELHAKQLAETIERLNDDYRSRLAEAERDADQLLKERDHAEGMADKLADALATMLCVDIGEHSSGNCPWTEALEAFEERATDSASVEGEK